MTEYPHLRLDRADHVLTVTLNRPERLNAIDTALGDELLDLLTAVERDDDVRAVVLTGAGRGFCAGADVGDLAFAAGAGDPAGMRRLMRRKSVPLAQKLLDMEKPLVAAVNGPCAGAGVGVALACDIVVASTAATFSLAFVRRGLVPDYASTFLLPRLVGLRAARELCLLGDSVDAERAAALGLTTAVVAASDLMDVAGEYARRLATGPAVALGLTKRLLAGSFEVDAATALDREFTAQALCFASADAAEGAAAFLEKRQPNFVGR